MDIFSARLGSPASSHSDIESGGNLLASKFHHLRLEFFTLQKGIVSAGLDENMCLRLGGC